MKTKTTLISFLIVFCLMSGCNRPNTPETDGNVQGQAQHQNQHDGNSIEIKQWMTSLGPGTTKYGAIDYHHVSLYDQVTGAKTTGEGFHALEEDDQLIIENVIYDKPGVTPGMIILIGNRAWVNVSFERELTEVEANEEIAEIKERLRQVDPRYEYEVIINEFI